MSLKKSPRGSIKSIGKPLLENENGIYIYILCVRRYLYLICLYILKH